jgi:hypothetical protein
MAFMSIVGFVLRIGAHFTWIERYFEDDKWAFKNLKWEKNMQNNGQMKKDKRTNNYL